MSDRVDEIRFRLPSRLVVTRGISMDEYRVGLPSCTPCTVRNERSKFRSSAIPGFRRQSRILVFRSVRIATSSPSERTGADVAASQCCHLDRSGEISAERQIVATLRYLRPTAWVPRRNDNPSFILSMGVGIQVQLIFSRFTGVEPVSSRVRMRTHYRAGARPECGAKRDRPAG